MAILAGWVGGNLGASKGRFGDNDVAAGYYLNWRLIVWTKCSDAVIKAGDGSQWGLERLAGKARKWELVMFDGYWPKWLFRGWISTNLYFSVCELMDKGNRAKFFCGFKIPIRHVLGIKEGPLPKTSRVHFLYVCGTDPVLEARSPWKCRDARRPLFYVLLGL